MDDQRVLAYLEHIGAERPVRADIDGLRELHLAHLRAVPFENLSIHLGEEVTLEPDALVRKVLGGRGGFCYELNGAFGALLRALGYDVELLPARVFAAGGEPGPPFDHMALRVRTRDGAGWLADVGFGRHSHLPLALARRDEQPDPGGVFTVREAPDGDLDVLRDGEPQYRVEQRPRTLGDFVPTCWWQRTSPLSHFRQSLVCSRLTAGGRVTLSGRTLVRTAGDSRQERELAGEQEVLAAYREHFGITLGSEPTVAPLP
jgi:N-hydroxyarylamine O-acetyltransferase